MHPDFVVSNIGIRYLISSLRFRYKVGIMISVKFLGFVKEICTIFVELLLLLSWFLFA